MIDYIIGKVEHIGEDYLIVENNGIGYKINTSTNSILDSSRTTEAQKLHTNLIVREDGMFLFGFTTSEEMDAFKLLLTVSKVGPKVACGILSALNPGQLQRAILTKDLNALCKGQGVGRKTAERIVLELKDKIAYKAYDDLDIVEAAFNSEYEEAVEALTSLGYSRYEVEKVLRTIETDDMIVEDIIKAGLRKLSF
ncbi:Holliday junction branch migration protein RuvA [Gudongella oleilytica]|jgi:Holliday junction DNA helicase RuvA|uniref:Holliday junction branch migration protein RuvA n=1 Tax=Gudongella oleilytica TaxID=1582259 RepID=UPI000EC8D255|nr:Holliday junction branch migration protein RuvA [Gudongella oleilytica]MDY0256915.1 Holliday junction branch migration protein RuvA [Gudongella oleilytica]HCO19378.1 Holliday junction branch migration protein RuvA [Tissierellales bacterium]